MIKKIIWILLALFSVLSFDTGFGANNPTVFLNARYIDSSSFSFEFNDISATQSPISGTVHIYYPAIDDNANLVYSQTGVISENIIYSGAVEGRTYLLEFYDNSNPLNVKHLFYYKHVNTGGNVIIYENYQIDDGIFENPEQINDVFVIQTIMAFIVIFILGMIKVYRKFKS